MPTDRAIQVPVAITEGHDLGWKLAWALKGWSGAELLDTYELEWRTVGARRAARSADPGAEASGADALADDLNGRLPHAWLAPAPQGPCPWRTFASARSRRRSPDSG